MSLPSARSVTADERTWAALAHGSSLLFTFGFIAPLIIWITHRQKSAFVAYHALQALTYQLLQMLYWLVVGVVGALGLVGLSSLSVLALSAAADSRSTVSFVPFLAIFGSQFLFIAFFMLALGLYIGVGLLGAGLVLGGRDFQYPLLGGWLKRYLERAPDELLPDRIDHYAAALGHLSILLPWWGLLVPLLLWLTQRQRSVLLRFQAQQALIYQLICLGVSVLFGACQMCACMLIFPVGMLSGPFLSELPHDTLTTAGPLVLGLFFIFFGGIMCLNLFQLLVTPLFALGGLWGAGRVLDSQDFHYPLLGRWLRQRQGSAAANDQTQPL